MRKFFAALSVLVSLSVAAPRMADAAEVKVSGRIRFRGFTGDDLDRNSRIHDSKQFADYNVRPRWTFIGKGKKVWGLFETDVADRTLGPGFSQNSNGRFGETNLIRVNVGINRWVMDAAIPGTTLRFRVGKTDWKGTGALQEVVGGNGLNRTHGIGIYGKLTKNLSLNFFNTQISEGVTAATDDNDYYLEVSWKPGPNLKIRPPPALGGASIHTMSRSIHHISARRRAKKKTCKTHIFVLYSLKTK